MIIRNGGCCGFCEKCKRITPIDGIEYYSQEVKRITELFVNEKMKTLNEKKLPIYFVTFENPEIALFIRQEYICHYNSCVKKLPKSGSSLTNIIDPNHWNVVYASLSKDILW